jgi:hypothetical protein
MPEVASPAGCTRAPRAFLWAFAGYSTLAAALTFPLVRHLSSRIPVDLEDSLWYVTVLWWNAHVVPLTDRWWDGFAFFPATGMMAFSDHLLGASLIASPLQWLGVSPIAAYNLTFLASFSLSAVAAHALAWTLTRRHDAAVIAGLAYGFNPYRVAHLEHLELLMAFGMPLALAALHRYAQTRRRRWLAAFAASLVLQALAASYYALFFGVLLGLWTLWFLRFSAWRDVLAIAAAGAAAVLALSPIVVGYARIHHGHALTRDFAEVLTFSADISSFVTASARSAFWGWTATLNGGERQLFPGLTITALAIAGVVVSRRARSGERPWLSVASRVGWALSALLLAVAAAAFVWGPWQLEYSWLRLSVTALFKPLSLALAFAIIAVALSPAVRTAYEQRSPLVFYLMAAVALFLCSLGPRPALLGEQVLYEPPYAWLMRLPFFADGGISVPTVRVPARFAMLGVLALSVAGSLAFTRIAASTRQKTVLLITVVTGIVADGSIRDLPLRDPERSLPVAASGNAAVMMLPLGDTRADTAAMYWAMRSGHPTVNGYHSYAPLSYHVLNLALADRDPTALDALASFRPLLIAADSRALGRSWASFVAGHPDARRVGGGENWTLFEVPLSPLRRRRCASDPVPITALFDEHGALDAATFTDQSAATRWITPHAQRIGDSLLIDLGHAASVCEVVISTGAEAGFYPRTLRVSTSLDGVSWQAGFLGKMGGAAFLGALENPRDARMSVSLSAAAGRYVRLQLDQSYPDYPWAVADVVVRGPRTSDPHDTSDSTSPATPEQRILLRNRTARSAGTAAP